jgi:hypothetical protein
MGRGRPGDKRRWAGAGSAGLRRHCNRVQWGLNAERIFVPGGQSCDLVETMRFDPEEGLVGLEECLERLKREAEGMGFAFDRHHARNELQAATFFLARPSFIKLRLSPRGSIAIEARPLDTKGLDE